MTVHDLFVFLNYLSVFVMAGCCASLSTHSESKMQKLALMVCMSLTVCCIGFLFRIEANCAETLIAGQKLVYAFVTHGMYLMLLFILEYCKFAIPKALRWFFHSLNLFVSVIVITLDHHKLFYRSYWAVDQGGYAILEKEYGPIHTLAVGLFVFYMIAAVAVAVIFSTKNIRRRSRYVWRLLIAVMIPCVAYIVPKLTDLNNDLQPIAFAAFTVMVIVMIYRNNLYDVDNIVAKYSISAMEDALIVFDEGYIYKGCNYRAETLFPLLKNVNIDSDIRIESQIISDFLDGTRKEYSDGDRMYDVSVRQVGQNERPNGRAVWLKDITMDRNYTDLMQEQTRGSKFDADNLHGSIDELSGVRNRRAYEEYVASIREGEGISNITVIAIDINGLKNVNDTIGHTAGDELIRGAASVIESTFARYGITFRTGGDEFFVILNDTAISMEKLFADLQYSVDHWHGKLSAHMALSYGCACGGVHPEMTIDELMIAADKAMSEHKRAYYETIGVDRRNRRR